MPPVPSPIFLLILYLSMSAAKRSCVVAEAGGTAQQQKLISAATYGARFLDDVEQADQLLHISEACKRFRALKHLSAPDVGVPLTVAQFVALTDQVVAARLALRHLHHLERKP